MFQAKIWGFVMLGFVKTTFSSGLGKFLAIQYPDLTVYKPVLVKF